MPINLPAVRDETIHDFLLAVFGKGLHPEDAAIEIGVPIELFQALRHQDSRVDVAWFLADEKARGLLTKPKNTLEMKHRFAYRFWPVFEQKLMSMLHRITDDAAGDAIVLELMKHKVISEIMPRETYGQQEITQKPPDPYAKLSDEALLAVVEKKLGTLADLKGQVDKAVKFRDAYIKGAIDAEYTVGDNGAAEGSGSPDGPPSGQQDRPLLVDPEAVGGDDDGIPADDDRRGQPVQRQDDVQHSPPSPPPE